ncbi:MAG: hypothetical protein Q8N77_04010 [Nanoarchaeota archaeon]|nr:hypothetical protein [Nanoarchaeota archaeon]
MVSDKKEDLHREFVKHMLKKAETKDALPETMTMLSPGKDPEISPQDFTIREEDLKKAEENVKRIKNSVK